MKRSVNFNGSRATSRRKALRPAGVIAAMRLVGMTDKEIRAALAKVRVEGKQ